MSIIMESTYENERINYKTWAPPRQNVDLDTEHILIFDIMKFHKKYWFL